MNKFEEYKEKLLSQSREMNADDAIEIGIQVGFDAVIALDLPVKFKLWTRTPEFMDWLYLQSVQDDEQVTKLAYQYWIENIYKPE
jgi:hypothetical protein